MIKFKRMLPVLLATLFIAGCSGSDEDLVTIDVQDYSQEEEGKTYDVDNGELDFKFDADTTQFSVTNKKNGQVWYSNPQNIEEDTIANGSNKDALYSTLIVKYSDSKGQDFSYDNYAFSIKDKRYSVEELKDDSGKTNGIKVLYTVGDVQKTYIVPLAITEERMNSFCEKMSSSDANKIKNFYRRIDINKLRPNDDKDALLEQYPDLEETKVFVMRDGQSDTKLEMFQKMFESAGYNKEEYEYDSSRIHVDLATGKAAFNIPVYYTLEGDQFVVRVPMNEIEYYKDYPITNLTTLPFFGAAGTDENGFIFVPDGPGGIINFNNGKTNQAEYYNQVYGADLCITRDAVVDESEVSYPVIGMAKNGGSFLSTIECGSSYAIVEGDIAGRLNSNNSVKFTYTMLHGENMDISGKSDVTVRNYEKSLPEEDIIQRYLFIESDNYVDMATAYREYLMKKYPTLADKTDDKLPFVLEMIGCVDGKEHILGIPVTKDLPLTRYEDADTIATELSDSGISDMALKYTGFSNGGVHNSTMKSVNLSGRLGSKGTLQDFVTNALGKGNDVYMDANFQYVFRNSLLDKYMVNRDTCKFVSRELCELSYYSPIYFAELPEEYEYYLARPEYAMETVDNFSEYIDEDLGTKSISIDDISMELSGDYNYKHPVSREKMLNMICDKYKELADKGFKVMTNSDYFYNIPYSDVVTGMVLNNKSFNIIDETIPFYQIALHGIVKYTAEPLNLSQNAEDTFLKSAEYGAGLYYTITKENAEVLQDSKYTEFFATDYSKWKDTIIDEYNRFSKDFSGTYDDYIVKHEKLAENVYRTEYESGLAVIVNYNYSPYNYKGTEVPERDYIVEGGVK